MKAHLMEMVETGLQSLMKLVMLFSMTKPVIIEFLMTLMFQHIGIQSGKQIRLHHTF